MQIVPSFSFQEQYFRPQDLGHEVNKWEVPGSILDEEEKEPKKENINYQRNMNNFESFD